LEHFEPGLARQQPAAGTRYLAGKESGPASPGQAEGAQDRRVGRIADGGEAAAETCRKNDRGQTEGLGQASA
jgi:hypothetical protein